MVDVSRFEDSEFVEETFKFWFNDHEHIRCPFPLYIQAKLKDEACNKFTKWLNHLKTGAEKEVNDMIVAEKFEEIIFETALNLVLTEDEKITIQYPFLPRLKDKLTENDKRSNGEESFIYDRVIIKRDDKTYLKVKLKRQVSQDIWETEFELPA